MLRNMLLGTASFLPLYNAEGGAAADPGADPTVVVDPAAAAAAGADPDPGVDPAAAPGGDPEPAPAAGEHGNKGKSPWYMRRISEEAAAKQRLADENAALREMLAKGGTADPAAAPAADPARPAAAAPQPGSPQFQTEVQREVARQTLMRDTTEVRNAGLRDFGSAAFTETMQIMNAIGATTDDFVLDLIAVDKGNAHKMFAELSKDPERAANLAAMDSRQRIAELTRMNIDMGKSPAAAPAAAPAPTAAAAPAAGRAASAAPRPAPQIQPSVTQTKDWRADNATDEEFDRGFRETMAKRSARR